MKRILGVIAAGLLAAASFHAAQAADPAVAADTSAKAAVGATATGGVAADLAVKPATQQFTLKDGTTLTVDDKQMAWTTDASGKNVAATDGDKATADGKTLTILSGKVVAGLEASGAASETPAAGTEEKKETPPATR